MSFVELSIVAIIALLLLGPDQLPGVARTIGKGLRDLRRASDDLKQTFEQEMVKLEAEVTPKAKPPPRVLIPLPVAAANAVVETATLSSSTTTLDTTPLIPGAVTLDQARQASLPPVDPGAMRAQARFGTGPLDPGAARAAARSAAIAAAAAQAAPPDLPREQAAAAAPAAPSEAPAQTAPIPLALNVAEPLPPEEEFKPLRSGEPGPAIAAPTGAPPATVPRRKPDPS